MWKIGAVSVNGSTFNFWVKCYEQSSKFGYEGGRASKIMLEKNGQVVFNFDRGLDVPPADKDTETALAILLNDYN